MTRVLVDGRAFSIAPAGPHSEYLRSLVGTLAQAGEDVSVLLFEDCLLDAADEISEKYPLRFAPFAGGETGDNVQMHLHTHYLTDLVAAGRFDVYLDASPFLGPARAEIPNAATIAVAMSLPLVPPHHADPAILSWRNGWLRLDRADAVICASAAEKETLAIYLGKTGDDLFVFAEANATSSDGLGRGLAQALSRHLDWRLNARLQVFSSLPGTFCGIADYTTAHLRDYSGVAALHFSDGDPSRLAHLPVKLFSYLDFDVVRSLLSAQRMFHLAASRALLPGFELLRRSAEAGDVAVVHERRFMHAFEYLMQDDGKRDLLGSAYYRSDKEADAFTRRTLGFSALDRPYGELSSWLEKSPAALVSPLSPAAKARHEQYRDAKGEPARNEFKSLEPHITFVPLGMDERAMPDVRRASRRFRAERGIPAHALVLGLFGQIVDHHRLVREAAEALLAIGKGTGWAVGQRPLFVLFSGRVGDTQMVADIQGRYAEAGATDRLTFAQPLLEETLDAQMKACDAAICFRLQAWGHQSNAQVRALALGVPALVNEASGWGYDPDTTIKDNDLEGGLRSVLDLLVDPLAAARMRRAARTEFERHHRAQDTMTQMLEIGRARAATDQAH